MAIRNEDAVLDAARRCVEEFGIKRTTLTEVARTAGVSRPTVYRRWADSRDLVADMLTREVGVALADSGLTECETRAQFVDAVVTGVESLREHPLFAKLFRTDSDLLLPYVLERLGRSQRAIVDVFVAAIAAGQQDGSIRSGDTRQIATMLLLVCQSAVQSARAVAPVLDPAQLSTELRAAVDGYLRPNEIGENR